MYVRAIAQSTYCKELNDIGKFGLVEGLKSAFFLV
jgi:hypothetical protein